MKQFVEETRKVTVRVGSFELEISCDMRISTFTF